MNKYVISLGFVSLFLTGCVGFYVPDDYNYIPSNEEVKDIRIQDSIKQYVQERSPMGYSYHDLEFGELYVIKDDEIKKLDKLIQEKNQLPLKADEYGAEYASVEQKLQQEIDAQKAFLKKNNIYPWYEINHLYAFENLASDSAIVYEFDFEVYPNYQIKDVHKKMALTLDPDRYKTLQYFLEQKPVYESSDWQWQEMKNSEFYNAAFSALENESDYKDKLLITIIDMTDYIRKRNSFDENDFAKKQIFNWEKNYIDQPLKTISISQLKSEIDTLDNQAILTGYSMTHDVYTEHLDDKTRFKYFFDLNYVITQVVEQKLTP